jgi:hypothetical protein
MSQSPSTRAQKSRQRRNLERPLDVLTEPQQRALLALARYRYLTIPQMIAAGVAKDSNHIRSDVLARLSRRASDNLVEAHEFPQFHAKGRLPRIYTLTKYGAEVVADMLRRPVAEILYPVGGVQYANDFAHRAAYVDCCIAFDAWIAADEARDCLEVRHYFDKTGANRGAGLTRLRAATRLDLPGGSYIIPDGLAFFDTGAKRRAVALEVHNFPDVGRIVKQLAGYVDHVVTDASSRTFGHDAAGRVLSISTDPAVTVRVMDRMLALPGFRDSRAFQLIAFNTLDSVKADFGTGWVLADRSPAGIFE